MEVFTIVTVKKVAEGCWKAFVRYSDQPEGYFFDSFSAGSRLKVVGTVTEWYPWSDVRTVTE